MSSGPHPAAAARTTPEARRGRSLVDRLVARFPGLLHLATRLTFALPLERLRLSILDYAHRRAYSAYNRRDWELNTAAMDRADYVFQPGDVAQLLPDAQETYRGIDGYLDAQELWLHAWSGLRVFPEGLLEAGEGRVLSLIRWSGLGGVSSVPIDQPGASFHEFRDGRLFRHTFWWDRDAAFRHAGLDPPGS